MEKSTFSPLYRYFRTRLVELREKADMTQRDLARQLRREHSFVSRIELGEKRLDVVEFYWVCRACNDDPVKVAADLMAEFARLEAEEKAAVPRRRKRKESRS